MPRILTLIAILTVMPTGQAMAQAGAVDRGDAVIAVIANYLRTEGRLSRTKFVAAMTHCPEDLRMSSCVGTAFSPSDVEAAAQSAALLANALDTPLTMDLAAAHASLRMDRTRSVTGRAECANPESVATFLLTSPLLYEARTGEWRIGIDVQVDHPSPSCRPYAELQEFRVSDDPSTGGLRVIGRRVLHVGHGAR
jgi:hypothetical protein